MKSRVTLWRIVGNPPVQQFKAWSTLNDFPHTHTLLTVASHISSKERLEKKGETMAFHGEGYQPA